MHMVGWKHITRARKHQNVAMLGKLTREILQATKSSPTWNAIIKDFACLEDGFHMKLGNIENLIFGTNLKSLSILYASLFLWYILQISTTWSRTSGITTVNFKLWPPSYLLMFKTLLKQFKPA
ncbi:hypothetical protein CR513_07261, partial [Mucuna pruriens]